MSTVANGGDGLSRMVQNPKRYFEEARARAAAQVDAEMRRTKRRGIAEANGAAPAAKTVPVVKTVPRTES